MKGEEEGVGCRDVEEFKANPSRERVFNRLLDVGGIEYDIIESG